MKKNIKKEVVLSNLKKFWDELLVLKELDFREGENRLDKFDYNIKRYFEVHFGSIETLVKADYYNYKGPAPPFLNPMSSYGRPEFYHNLIIHRLNCLDKIQEDIELYGVPNKVNKKKQDNQQIKKEKSDSSSSFFYDSKIEFKNLKIAGGMAALGWLLIFFFFGFISGVLLSEFFRG